MKVLFVCSENRLRSPTAAAVFADHPGLETRSAGTNANCANPVSEEALGWADAVLVMENTHRNRLNKRFRGALKEKKLVVLGIPDEFEYMDPVLVEMLERRVPPLLGLPTGS